MIHRDWQDPNFRFIVEDANGNRDTYIAYAQNTSDLQIRLETLGYTVIQIQPFDFQDWKQRAQAASLRVQQHYDQYHDVKEFGFPGSLWAELKFHLFELFGGKCAYCEWKPLIGSWADVEHYRPKAAVFEDANHPGYFWLAYNFENYLPSCQRCNQARGKETHFPVADNTRAYQMDALAAEQPLLINPLGEDPRRHILFEESGQAVPRPTGDAAKADASIRFYFLNRPGIFEERRSAMESASRDLNARMMNDPGRIVTEWSRLKQEYLSGRVPYAAAAIDHLDRLARKWFDELASSLGGG